MNEQTADTQTNREVKIHSLYLKDVSFESPNSPAIFSEINQPKMNLNVTVDSNAMDNNMHEVILKVTVDAKMEDKTIFLVELQQAGLFTLNGFNEAELHQVLGIYCPSTLFPYAREAVSNLTTKGGFPPFALDPINFEMLYAQQQAQQVAQQ